MCRMLVSICLALVLALVSTTYADIFGNWENATADMEGWGPAWGSTSVTFASSTIGHTLDEKSLAMHTTAGSYWQLQWTGTPMRIFGTARMKIDVTYIASEWLAYDEFGDLLPGQESVWARFDAMAIQPGWHQVNPTAIDRNTGLAHGKTYNPFVDGDITLTYSWDMTGFSIPTSNKMYFAVQYGGNIATGNYYLDNARSTIPEPATMALMGLGGLALIRRKK